MLVIMEVSTFQQNLRWQAIFYDLKKQQLQIRITLWQIRQTGNNHGQMNLLSTSKCKEESIYQQYQGLNKRVKR